MSLFSSIRMAANALRANEIGLQVVGQNIANANTPGYIREELVLTPAPTQAMGSLQLGMGVNVKAVVQKIDSFLEGRLRSAVSDSSSAQAQEAAYQQLESLINEMGDNDISTQLDSFFSSISNILNQPESSSVRNLAVLQGGTLTEAIQNLTSQVTQLREDANQRIVSMAGDINRLTEQIRRLNVQIAAAEGGDISQSDAVGLRDERLSALQDLAKLVNIRVEEQPSGSVTVYCGGTYLVADGVSRPVEAVLDSDRGMTVANIQVAETDFPVEASGGELYGLLQSRDKILGGFTDSLNEFSQTLIYEFNKIYSAGQGLSGYDQVTSEFAVDGPNLALNKAGLKYTPVNGSFQVMTRATATGLTSTHDINVDLNGVGDDTTLSDLVDQLNEIPGLTAKINTQNKLEITASSGEEFSFAGDTSGLLAALGINTFFKGSGASDIGVSDAVRGDPTKFAASLGGIGQDTQNAVTLANFLDLPLDSKSGASLGDLYDRLTAGTTQASSIAQSTSKSAQSFEETLRGQEAAISGVSIDEEAVQMLTYQRAYQAAARYISVLSDLFDILVQI